MVKSIIYIEGGGDSKELQIRCREGFRKLFEKCGYKNRMPRFFACGGRNAAFDDFKTAHKSSQGIYVALLVDSEDPMQDINKTWEHLKKRDGWKKPDKAADDQVLMMTTCMETWIIADHKTLKEYFDPQNKNLIILSGLPKSNLENHNRHKVQESLMHATRNCKVAYAKDKRSFEIIGRLDSDELRSRLPSFKRITTILDEKL